MRTLHYHKVDVFTDRAFGGNPLAVFPDGQGLDTTTMQALAKELNLSETTFVLPPQDPQNTYNVRIFTPAMELPMAGHPTVGTAFVLAHQRLIPWTGEAMTIRFEERVGVIPISLSPLEPGSLFIQMQQPLPNFGAHISNRELIAEMLSLPEEALEPSLPVEVVSCGVPFLLVPVRNLEAMRKIRLRLDVWEHMARATKTVGVMIFTVRETELPGSTVHSRVFAPQAGVPEDPATGAASGPLGSYLVHHKTVTGASRIAIVNEQGIEMGRPSLIQIEIEHENNEIRGVFVGGQSFYMGEGDFYVE